MATAHDFKLPITTEANLRDYVKFAFGVTVPNTKVCPHHTTPWRAFADAYFAKSSVTVWLGSRGLAGKSFLLSLLASVEAQTLKADASVLGGSGEQSGRVLEYMTEFWKHPNAPRHLLLADVAREQRLSWGNTVHALTASSKSVRGAHPQRLRLDEVDEMDLPIFDAAMGQTMVKRGVEAQTVCSSTHHYPNGTMTEILKRAADKGWPVYRWCFQETSNPIDGWLTKSEIERKKNEVTKGMWEAEYELQEPSPEGRAIDTAAVEQMFNGALGTFDGALSQYIEIEAPDPSGEYVNAADWAKKQDKTEIGTIRIDCFPARLVAYEQMNRLPWPVMVGRYNERCKRYKGKNIHDGTGIGDVVGGYLEVEAEGIIMAGRARTDMISNAISAIEHGEIESPMIISLCNELRFTTNDDVYGDGHLPDGLSMLSLACKGIKRRLPSEDTIKAWGASTVQLDSNKIGADMLQYLMSSGVKLPGQ